MGDDEDAFLATILDSPADDVPRLVFADWLDERDQPGDAARAEFIRLTVAQPDITFWSHGVERCGIAERPGDEKITRALDLCLASHKLWVEQARRRLAASPFCRWLGRDDCRWGYRRGFVAVFEGTQQVLLDAWDDLFRLGPIEEVVVRRGWDCGIVLSLRRFLNRSCLRIIRVYNDVLMHRSVENLMEAADWLRQFERVELVAAATPEGEVESRLRDWLSKDSSLRHVQFKHG